MFCTICRFSKKPQKLKQPGTSTKKIIIISRPGDRKRVPETLNIRGDVTN